MEKRTKIILNGVEVDDDFTGIIEERNGKLVGDIFGKSGKKRDVFGEREKAEAVRESHFNTVRSDEHVGEFETKKTGNSENVVPINLNRGGNSNDSGDYWSKPQNPSITDRIFKALDEMFPN